MDSNDELTKKMTISLITNNDSNNPVEDQYKCQGVKSDETNFNSNSIPLRVFPAKTTQVPADNGHTYEDESHELVCQFPDSDVATEYTVSWEFNKQVRVLFRTIYLNVLKSRSNFINFKVGHNSKLYNLGTS